MSASRMMGAHTTASGEDAADQRRKEQSRVRQLRYRLRKLQYEHDLEASIQRLHEEIRALEESRMPVIPGIAPRISGERAHALATSQRFVDCFAFGFVPTSSPPWLPRSYLSVFDSVGAPSRDQTQLTFVEEAVDPLVTWGAHCGHNAFLEHWRRYASMCECFHIDGATASFEASVYPCDEIVENLSICVVYANTSIVLSAKTISSLLPLLPSAQPELEQMLNGKSALVPSQFSLEFNSSGRVTRFDARLDWVAALLPLLSSLEAVALALDGANLSLAGQIACDAPTPPPAGSRVSGASPLTAASAPALATSTQRSAFASTSPACASPLRAAHEAISAVSTVAKTPATQPAVSASAATEGPAAATRASSLEPSRERPPLPPPVVSRVPASRSPSPRMQLAFLLTSECDDA